MFKSSRWKNEKNKIKVVFKLQFHATQVFLAGVDALVVSIVPADIGKPTTKLEKATIKDGSCSWDNPVHETVKFVQDPKSGKILERIYHFVVENGSSKGGVLGDASIDISCYALCTKSSSVSLTINGSKSEILLHVTIQRMPNSVDIRGSEEIESLKQISQDRSLRAKMSMEDIDMNVNTNVAPIEDIQVDKCSNPSSKIINKNRRESNGSDITLSSSDSSLGIDTLQENTTKKNDNNNNHHDPKSFFSFKNNASMVQIPVSDKPSKSIHDNVGQKSWEWLESSTDDSSESGDNLIGKLKRDVSALSRQAEMSELELQALRKQIVKETRKGGDFLKEIFKLKEENECLKEEFEKMKSNNPCDSDGKTSDFEAIVEEFKQELNYEKGINKNLQIQLQKTQESNNELLLAVHDLDEMLGKKNKEIENIMEKLARTDDDDEEQKESKDLNVIEQKMRDLQKENVIYRREKEEIEVQMEQLALDYEILKQENHEISYKLEHLKMQYECSSPNELENQIESLENELNEKSERFSQSLETISELESQVKNLKDELEKHSHEHSDSLLVTKELEIQVSSLENELNKKSEWSLKTITELESQVKNLKDELEKQSQVHSDSLIDVKELEFQVSSLENKLNEKSERFSTFLKTIANLESQVKNLKDELEMRSQEYSDSLTTVKELEFQVLRLEDELEKQAQGFEADLEALTRSKVDQEQRAIQAEETLNKIRFQNASAAQNLQDQFKKLAVKMTSSFEANENLATKALTESNEIRMQKIILEEKLKNSFESSQLIIEQHKSKLHELSTQVLTMTKQLQELQYESNHKSERIEHDSKLAKETEKTLEQEISTLKTQMGHLETKNKALLKQVKESLTELDHKNRSFIELEKRFEQCKNEEINLETRISFVKSRAEDSLKELRRMTCLIDEKDSKTKEMQIEIDSLKNQCKLMKQLLSEDEFEKEKLRNEVFLLKNDLKTREDFISNDEVSNMQEKIKLLEGQIKQKEFDLENSRSSFRVKEKEMHRKIKGLEHSLESLSHSTTMLCEQKPDKASNESDMIKTNAGSFEAETNVSENLVTFDRVFSENGPSTSTMSVGETSEAKNAGNMNELLCEMAIMKQRNEEMESELKEIQERYSEISLKFAEVEGERQQLVMKLRYLKNAKKTPSSALAVA